MARMTLTLPDELAERVRSELPGIVYSVVLQDALRARLKCGHRNWACLECGASVDRKEATGVVLAGFYHDLAHRLAELVAHDGTVEGAARVARNVARDQGVNVEGLALPRRTRAERENPIPYLERKTA